MRAITVTWDMAGDATGCPARARSSAVGAARVDQRDEGQGEEAETSDRQQEEPGDEQPAVAEARPTEDHGEDGGRERGASPGAETGEAGCAGGRVGEAAGVAEADAGRQREGQEGDRTRRTRRVARD